MRTIPISPRTPCEGRRHRRLGITASLLIALLASRLPAQEPAAMHSASDATFASARQPSLDQTVLRFGAHELGQPVTVTLAVANGDSGPSTISAVVIYDRDASDFSAELRAGSPVTLAPGESALVDVTFASMQPGPRRARLLIARHGAGPAL